MLKKKNQLTVLCIHQINLVSNIAKGGIFFKKRAWSMWLPFFNFRRSMVQQSRQTRSQSSLESTFPYQLCTQIASYQQWFQSCRTCATIIIIRSYRMDSQSVLGDSDLQRLLRYWILLWAIIFSCQILGYFYHLCQQRTHLVVFTSFNSVLCTQDKNWRQFL